MNLPTPHLTIICYNITHARFTVSYRLSLSKIVQIYHCRYTVKSCVGANVEISPKLEPVMNLGGYGTQQNACADAHYLLSNNAQANLFSTLRTAASKYNDNKYKSFYGGKNKYLLYFESRLCDNFMGH